MSSFLLGLEHQAQEVLLDEAHLPGVVRVFRFSRLLSPLT